jgi:thiol-disulfide isomerase/thioredoxin
MMMYFKATSKARHITAILFNHFTALSIFLFTGMRSFAASPAVTNGIWLGSIERTDGARINFNFEWKDSAQQAIIYVLNGAERLKVDNIKQSGDSVFIEMPFFDSRFALQMQPDGHLAGSWIKNYNTRPQVLAFEAWPGKTARFIATTKPLHNITGRWATVFKTSSTEDVVGEFKQEGAKVTGTFLTTTGDYRFLEGVISGDTLQLSAFDGGHAYLFTALVTDSTIIGGRFYSGATATSNWSAIKDANAALPDAFAITKLKKDSTRLSFSFWSTDHQKVSLSDARFKNKVVVIQIMGSWCPNCMDETKFLSEYYKNNHTKGIEFIGLAYERTTDFNISAKALQSFKKRFDVQYPILITGAAVTDTDRAAKTLPQLETIDGFPTTIFIDKKGVITKIHTGFNGPGTGDHYEIFKKEFDDIIKSML